MNSHHRDLLPLFHWIQLLLTDTIWRRRRRDKKQNDDDVGDFGKKEWTGDAGGANSGKDPAKWGEIPPQWRNERGGGRAEGREGEGGEGGGGGGEGASEDRRDEGGGGVDCAEDGVH